MNTRAGDVPDPHHNVSADIPDIIDITTEAGISRIIGIHGTPGTVRTKALLREGYSGIGYNGEIVCPAELTTIEL